MPANSDYPPAIEKLRVTADGVVFAAAGKLWGISVSSTTAEASLKVHDDTDAADATAIVAEANCGAGTAFGPTVSVMFPRPLDVTKLFANVTGTGAVGYIYFQAAATYAS